MTPISKQEISNGMDTRIHRPSDRGGYRHRCLQMTAELAFALALVFGTLIFNGVM